MGLLLLRAASTTELFVSVVGEVLMLYAGIPSKTMNGVVEDGPGLYLSRCTVNQNAKIANSDTPGSYHHLYWPCVMSDHLKCVSAFLL